MPPLSSLLCKELYKVYMAGSCWPEEDAAALALYNAMPALYTGVSPSYAYLWSTFPNSLRIGKNPFFLFDRSR